MQHFLNSFERSTFFLEKHVTICKLPDFHETQFELINQPVFFLCGKNYQNVLRGGFMVYVSGVPICSHLHGNNILNQQNQAALTGSLQCDP